MQLLRIVKAKIRKKEYLLSFGYFTSYFRLDFLQVKFLQYIRFFSDIFFAK